MIRLLFDQSGQVPMGGYYGGIMGGIGKGLSNLTDVLLKKQQLDEQRKTSDLQRKMLDAQLKKLTAEEEEKAKQRDLLGQIGALFSETVPQVANSQEELAGLEDYEVARTVANRPRSLEEVKQDPRLFGLLAQAQSKEFATGLMRSVLPGAAGGVPRLGGFKTLEELQAAARAHGYTMDRARQDPISGLWIGEFSNPVNLAAEYGKKAGLEYLAKNPGDHAGAQRAQLQAMQDYRFATEAAGGAGAKAGPAAQTIGQPVAPYVGTQQPAPQTGAPPIRFDPNLSAADRAYLEGQGIKETAPPYPTSGQPNTSPPPVQNQGQSQILQAGRLKTITETQARIDTELKTKPLPVETQRLFNAAVVSLENAKIVQQTYRPDYVGTGVPASMRNWNNIVAQTIQRDEQGRLKYVPGALVAQFEQMIGTLSNPQQARFYRAVLDMQDQFLRARSGAQINEPEFQRLVRASVNIFSSPEQFQASFDDFTRIIQVTAETIRQTATTPAAQLGVPQAPQIGNMAPPPSGWRKTGK